MPCTPLTTSESVISLDARPKRDREHLVQHRPQSRVIDVEDVVGWVGDEPGDDLRGFHGDLPVGKPEHPDAKTENAAEEQDPEGAVHSRKYVADRIDLAPPQLSGIRLTPLTSGGHP